MTTLFTKAIEGNESTLVKFIDVDHGLWRELQSRKILTDEHLADCKSQVSHLSISEAPCGLWVCKNGPAPFPGQMSYKATKPGLVFLYLSMFFIVLVFIRAHFYVLLVFIICVVCLLVVLAKLSLLAKLLARKTPLSSELSPLQFLALA